MTSPALEVVLSGSEEDADLWALYLSISDPKNEAPRAFHRAWEALELLGSGGFEKLFEQETRLEEYADALAAVGLPQMRPIFDRVLTLVPSELRQPGGEEELFSHLRAQYDALKQLAYGSYDASTDCAATVARYVRRHGDEFK